MIVLCFGLKLGQKALFYKALAAHIVVFFENSYFFQGHLLPLTTSRAAESLRRVRGEPEERPRGVIGQCGCLLGCFSVTLGAPQG